MNSNYLRFYESVFSDLKNKERPYDPKIIGDILTTLYHIVKTEREHTLKILDILSRAKPYISEKNNSDIIEEIFTFVIESDKASVA